MGLFVDEPSHACSTRSPARTSSSSEPERVRSRLDELLGEERELTDVVAATWRASEEVPLLHRELRRGVSTDRVDLALDARASRPSRRADS